MNQTDYLANFSRNLKGILVDKGMTQADLARGSGVSSQSISKYCKGESLPDLATVADISKVLGVSVDHLLGLNEKSLVSDREYSLRDLVSSFVTIVDALGLHVHKQGIDIIDPIWPSGLVAPYPIVESELSAFFEAWSFVRLSLADGLLSDVAYRQATDGIVSASFGGGQVYTRDRGNVAYLEKNKDERERTGKTHIQQLMEDS